jgi:hypothetical protein
MSIMWEIQVRGCQFAPMKAVSAQRIPDSVNPFDA